MISTDLTLSSDPTSSRHQTGLGQMETKSGFRHGISIQYEIYIIEAATSNICLSLSPRGNQCNADLPQYQSINQYQFDCCSYIFQSIFLLRSPLYDMSGGLLQHVSRSWPARGTRKANLCFVFWCPFSWPLIQTPIGLIRASIICVCKKSVWIL